MKYAVFANGEMKVRPQVGDEWIAVAVDGGMRHVERVDVVVGDLDSIEGVPECEVAQFPKEKNETDLELALLWVKERGGKIVRIYGALGGRVDHEMGNIFLLGDERWKDLDIAMVDGTTEVRVLWPGEFQVARKAGDLVSLFPMDEVCGITSQGLHYPLQDEVLRIGEIRGISNVLVEKEAIVTHTSGRLIAILQEA